ncbi:MAG TPA: hypothetical protein VGR90_03625, partial [Acidimicrobiales bacterium]|nr:hypothetical protein [Acidimicrobiales bacterium]
MISRGRIVRAIGAAAVVGAALLPAPHPSAAASAPSTLSLTGHGWGHGVGMGQWGALGYALSGTAYGSILDHFYGGTAAGTQSDAPIRVRIVENDGNDLIVTSGAPFTAAGASYAAGQAVLMHLTATPDTWAVSSGPGCAGPWTPVGTASDNGGSAPPAQVTPS